MMGVFSSRLDRVNLFFELIQFKVQLPKFLANLNPLTSSLVKEGRMYPQAGLIQNQNSRINGIKQRQEKIEVNQKTVMATIEGGHQ